MSDDQKYPVLDPFIVHEVNQRGERIREIGYGIDCPDNVVLLLSSGEAHICFDDLEALARYYGTLLGKFGGIRIEIEKCHGFPLVSETEWAKIPKGSEWARMALKVLTEETKGHRPFQLCTDWQIAQGALRSIEGSGTDGDVVREVFIRWALMCAEKDKPS